MSNKTVIEKDLPNKTVVVTRDFNAPLDKVWQAWTDAGILDKWWAPKPWRAETKSMNFTEGGTWLYSMVGPEGERHWSKADFKTIHPQKEIIATDAFCDEEGKINNDFPRTNWHNRFTANGDTTRVEVTLTFDSEEQLEKLLEMGFSEGFSMAHDNLDELLAQ